MPVCSFAGLKEETAGGLYQTQQSIWRKMMVEISIREASAPPPKSQEY